MKHILTLLPVLGLALTAQAQVTVDDFENTSNQWNTVSCGNEIVGNPFQTGLNLSCKCLKITRAPGCDNWSGAIYTLPQAVTGYSYVHALMYRNNNHMPNLKITDNGTNLDMQPQTTIVANQWQDVVFDISAKAQADFIFFMADREDLTEDAIVYIDDIIFSNDATPRTTPNQACGQEPPVTPSDEYTLVWNEDFTESALDQAVWNIEVNGDGGGNNELQYYCEKGVSLGVEPTTGKHCLILTATKESYKNRDCTSGRVNTKNKMYYTFGRIDARIKFPNTANGLWPAFWQMGNDFDQVGWPRCGETDIIELGHSNGFNGKQDRYFNGAMHMGSKWDAVASSANSVTWPYSVEDTFHIVTMIWTPTSIDMYMDKDAHPENGAYFHQDLDTNDNPDYDRSIVFTKPNFLIANLAIGGNFPGIYSVNQITALANGPRSMYIDWIRIYQRGDANQSFHSPSDSDPIEPENAQGIVDVQSDNVPSTKILYNGQLLIRRGEKIYTPAGQLIK